MSEPSLQQQIAAARREIRLREYVYPRRIALHKMTQEQAKHELELMRAILATLERLDAEQRPELFPRA